MAVTQRWWGWEGAAKIEGGAGGTVGVTGAVGTDWLISHSHPQGIKDREGWWVWTFVHSCVCMSECV